MQTLKIYGTDSGVSCHMTYHQEWLTDFKPVIGELVLLGDGKQCCVTGKETVLIEKLVNGRWLKARIENVLLVPKIQKNLFSVGACAKKGYLVSFKEQKVMIKKDHQVQAIGYKQASDIYRLMFKVTSNKKNNDKLNEVNPSATLQVWHERLGHINQHVKECCKEYSHSSIKFSNTDKFFCEPCQYGKAHHLSLKKRKSEHRHWQPGEYIHIDICGPFSETFIGGSRYYLLFVDKSTNHRSVFFIKHKSDVLEKLKNLII